MKSDEEIKKIVTDRILRDSADKDKFKGCKLKKEKKPHYEKFELERDSFGHYTNFDINGRARYYVTDMENAKIFRKRK